MYAVPEACADALRAYFSWKVPRPAVKSALIGWPAHLPSKGKLNESESLSLFAALGVPVVRSAIAEAPAFEHGIAYPVAVKVLSADIAHKSEVGGVVLGVGNAQELKEAAGKIARATGRPVEQLLVQKMESGLAEAIDGPRALDSRSVAIFVAR